MKNKLLLSMTAFSILFSLFNSCKKDSSTTTSATPSNTTTGGLLTAKINGASWAPSADSSAATLMNGQINITGVARNGEMITITLLDTVTGTYDLSSTGTSAGIFQISPTASSTYNSQAGWWTMQTNKLSISSIDKTNKKMTGTFSFKAYNYVLNDSVSITDGVFNNLPYSTSVVSTGNNVFNVNIDGSAYHPTLISGISSGGNLNIIASITATNQSVGITVPDNITPGTYSFAPFGTYNAQYNASASIFLLVSSGSITITEHNTVTKKIVGTFNFVATQFGGGSATSNLTNGSFTIYYQ